MEIKETLTYSNYVDEVQFMPRFEEVLNSLLRMSDIDVQRIVAAGNNPGGI